MGKKVLVAYGSKYGATAEIAEKIGEELSNSGASVDVLSVEKVGSLEQYDAVVIGSAIYIGRWRKEAVRFVTKNQQGLANKKVWVFVSGPTGDGDAVESMQGRLFPEKLKLVFAAIQPIEITAFHGEVDLEKLSGLEKWVIKNVKAPIGDYRQWDAISKWAKNISKQLK